MRYSLIYNKCSVKLNLELYNNSFCTVNSNINFLPIAASSTNSTVASS